MLNKANLLLAAAAIAPLLFAAGCGSTRKTVIVNPPANSTVVVPADGNTKVVTPDDRGN